MPRLSAILALLLFLTAAGPALAQLDQRAGPGSPQTKEEVQLYNPQQDKLVGRVSIPDTALATLVQPEGREWREFRTVWLRWIVGGLAVATTALLLGFFLIRGTIRIHGGRDGHTIHRFNAFERANHWMTAVSFILMAITGAIMTFGRPLLIPLMGHQAFTPLADYSKILHNFIGLPFLIGVVLMLVLWIRDNIPEKADWVWIRTLGGALSRKGEHPEPGRFNAGQKGVFWAVVFGGLLLSITGYLMMIPFAITGIAGMQIMHVLHGVVAGLMIALIIGHIYIGTVGMEGAFDAMGNGKVDVNWAREHHRGWYNRIMQRSPKMPAE